MLLKTLLLFLGVVLFNTVFTNGENPGLNVQISEKAFISGSHIGLAMAKKFILKQHIPSQSGHYSFFTYNVYNLKIKDFTYGSPSMKFNPGSQVQFILPGLKIHLTGTFTGKALFSSTTSSFDIVASNIGVNFAVLFGENKTTKKMTAAMGACSASVPKVDIHFHGGAAFIINIFSKYFAGKIKTAMKSQICSSNTINTVNAEISKIINEIPSYFHIMSSFYLGMNLIKPPFIVESALKGPVKGEVFYMDDHEECPLPVRSMEELPRSSLESMVTLQVSPYLLNSFAYVAHKNKLIRLTITSKTIRNKSFLNTTCSNNMCIGHLIPAIGKLYPNQILSVLVESTQMPDVYIKANNVLLDLYLSITLYLSTDNPNKPLLILPVTIHTEGKSDIVQQIIHFKISTMNVTLGVIRKGLPIKIDVKQFERSINLMINLFALPYINKKGGTGIPISTFIQTNMINNTKLNIGLNSAILMTDVSLNLIGVDDELTNQILQLVQTTLMRPAYGIGTSLHTVLRTAFSNDRDKFANILVINI